MRTINEHDIDNYMARLGKHESQFIIPASECAEEVKARLRGEGGTRGDLLPWSKTHNCIQLRPAEVSLWVGVNGHGKTSVLSMVIAWLLKSTKALNASMEMKPSATMEKMIKQVAGTGNPADKFVDQFLQWTDNRLWIYDQLDSVKPDRILGMIHYAADELKVKHIVIDSLMKCGISPEDYPGQKNFVDKLCWAAKAHNIHIHLVHHVRKGDKEGNIPDKFDIKGAGEITDLVDNVFIVHRNKKKEEKLRIGAIIEEGDPDCILKIAKARHQNWEGVFKLWFHKDSMQYTPNSENRPLPFNLGE